MKTCARIFIPALLVLSLCGCQGFFAAFRPAPKDRTALPARPARTAETRARRGAEEEPVTRLTGLNATELEAVRAAKGAPHRSSVYDNKSYRDSDPLLDSAAKGLNESDSERFKKERKDDRRQLKRNQNWVY